MVIKKRLAIIPARSGSKRLPGKNSIDFFGKPLLAWSIEAALHSRLFDRVIVSTDDINISKIAEKYGADVPFLREAHADDYSNVSDVALHTLRQAEDKLSENYEQVVHLQATCPLRTAEDIKFSVSKFETCPHHFQMSCYPLQWTNPWWAFQMNKESQADFLFPDMIGVRSQDQPRLFGLTGAICIANVEELIISKTFYGPGQKFVPISWISAVDIDDAEDLLFARASYLARQGI